MMECFFCGKEDAELAPVRTASFVGGIPIKRTEAFSEDTWRVCPKCLREFWRKTAACCHSIRVILNQNKLVTEWDGSEIATTTDQSYASTAHGRRIHVKAVTREGRKMFGFVSVNGMRGTLRAYGSHQHFIQDITVELVRDGESMGHCAITRWQDLRNGELKWSVHAGPVKDGIHFNEGDEIASTVLAWLINHHGGAGYGTKFTLECVRTPETHEAFMEFANLGMTWNSRVGVYRAGA